MKLFKFSFFALLLALSLPLIFVACDNDDEADPTPTPDPAMVTFNFNYSIGDQALVYGDIYEINGTAVSFDLAHFYVGGIELMPDEGDVLTMKDKYLLVKPGEGPYEIGAVDAGHYDMLKFFVGVGPEENSQSEDDFTNRPADDPLAVQNPSMHWSWASGYRFIRIDGQADTDGDGTPDTPMEFHLGTDPLLINYTFMGHKDLEEGTNEYTMNLDLEKVFTDVDLSTEFSTHTMDNMPLAMKIKDNFATAISMGEE
jgi:hypothetical protein